VCVCVSIHVNGTITFERNDLWPEYLSFLVHLAQPGSCLKVKVIDQSLWSQMGKNYGRKKFGELQRPMAAEGVPLIASFLTRTWIWTSLTSSTLCYKWSVWTRVRAFLVMAALSSRCGHYIFVLWFLICSIFLFSSSNVSRRRLDVYHTSTHGAALLRISDTGLKSVACGSRKIQDAKNRQNSPSAHHRTTLSVCRAIPSQLRHISTVGKNC